MESEDINPGQKGQSGQAQDDQARATGQPGRLGAGRQQSQFRRQPGQGGGQFDPADHWGKQ